MTPEQESAFQTGAGYSMAGLSLLLMLIICAVTLLWGSWVLLATYKGWGSRIIKLEKVLTAALRVGLLITLILYLSTT